MSFSRKISYKIIYTIFVSFLSHLKRICYSFFCLRLYCDLLGYLFYQEILSSVNFANVNQ